MAHQSFIRQLSILAIFSEWLGLRASSFHCCQEAAWCWSHSPSWGSLSLAFRAPHSLSCSSVSTMSLPIASQPGIPGLLPAVDSDCGLHSNQIYLLLRFSAEFLQPAWTLHLRNSHSNSTCPIRNSRASGLKPLDPGEECSDSPPASRCWDAKGSVLRLLVSTCTHSPLMVA